VAVLDLSGKFGASTDDAAALQRLARRYTAQLELSFTLVRNASSRSRGGGRWR